VAEADVAIIGAGIGGLAAAAQLARRGLAVRVYERNPLVGGKMNLVTANGYQFDTGPSLITMPQVLARHFAECGRRLEDYLTLSPLTPLCRYFWPDGKRLDASSDMATMVAGLAQLDPADAAAYPRFIAHARQLYRRTAATFIFGSLEPGDLLRALLRAPLDPLRIDPFRTMHQAVSSFFRDQRVRQLFDRYATYNGSSPYLAPATLCVIPYVEYRFGGWYPQGGVYQIAKAMARLAEEMGAEICVNTEVAEVIVAHGRAGGVRLADGGATRARAVLSNVDVLHSYSQLLPPGVKWRYDAQRLASIEPSCSGFVILLGVRRQFPQLAHHNIFFSRDYRAEFDAIFERKQPAPEPTIYLAATSKSDPTQAPPACENIFVLVNAPYISEQTAAGWWDEYKQAYRNLILARLREFGIELEAEIEYEQIITPADLAARYGAWRGAIYGLSSNQRMAAFMRPPIRAREVKRLYFAGGSTHPGGGVPLVTLSGRLAARLIAADLAKGRTGSYNIS
jgi:phytoene desaturase